MNYVQYGLIVLGGALGALGSLDALQLISSGKILPAFLYMLGSVGVGLAATYIGMVIAQIVFR